MTTRYLIIGMGPAGVAAADSLRKADPSAQITVFCDDPFGFYSRPGLGYYINKEVREKGILLPYSKDLKQVKSRVIEIDPSRHMVVLEDRSGYEYDKLLFANGAQATPIQVPGEELDGVVKLDNLQDAKRFLKMAKSRKAGVVTGGGITALELVEGMKVNGLETHFVYRGKRYWHNILDEVESAVVEQRLIEEGIILHPSCQITAILGNRKGRVSAVEVDSGPPIACDMVGVGIGVRPRKELADKAGLKTDRGILTDQYLQTSDPDIYAAGDVAQVYDEASGTYTLDMLWGSAIAQGRIAGLNMAGQNQVFQQIVPFNVTRLAGLTTTIIGSVGTDPDVEVLAISRGETERWRYIPNVLAVQDVFHFNRTRVMISDTIITGALIMGDQTLSRPLQDLVTWKVDISGIRADLVSRTKDIAGIIVGHWKKWRASFETA